jgi:hypothetical protein
VFMRDLVLPRGPDREIVHDARDRQYTSRGSETRTLSTVGAFRVVSARDLRDHNDRPADPRSGDLRHLREEKLIRTELATATTISLPWSTSSDQHRKEPRRGPSLSYARGECARSRLAHVGCRRMPRQSPRLRPFRIGRITHKLNCDSSNANSSVRFSMLRRFRVIGQPGWVYSDGNFGVTT